MTESQQLQTTSSGSKADGRFPLGHHPHNHSGSCVPELVGHRWGLAELTSRTIVRIDGHRHVQIQCVSCGAQRLTNYYNLRSGKSRGCQSCSQKCGAPKWLLRRMEAARQRCTNEKDKAYPNYGGRGVRFCFPSVALAAVWVMENLGLHQEMELDRVDNNGGYAPGNLRYIPRRVNTNNRRGSTILRFHSFRGSYPTVRYADNTLRNLLSRGLTDEEIVAKWAAPSCKPKGVYGTFSTADQDTVSQLTES